MKKFDINVIRTSISSKTISVTANNLEQAQGLAVNEAGNHEFPNGMEVLYKVQNCPNIEKELITIAAGVFTSGDDAYNEYQKLIEAKNTGNGEDYASNHAEVWEPFEYFTISDLVSAIETHIDNLRSFTSTINGQ